MPADKWTKEEQETLHEIELSKNRIADQLQNLQDQPETKKRWENVVDEIGAIITGLQPDQYGNNVTLDQGLTPPNGLQIIISRRIFNALNSETGGFSINNHLQRSSISQFDVQPVIKCLSRYHKQLTINPPADYIKLETVIVDLYSELDTLFPAHSNG